MQASSIHVWKHIKHASKSETWCVKALGHHSSNVFKVGLKNAFKMVFNFFSMGT